MLHASLHLFITFDRGLAQVAIVLSSSLRDTLVSRSFFCRIPWLYRSSNWDWKHNCFQAVVQQLLFNLVLIFFTIVTPLCYMTSKYFFKRNHDKCRLFLLTYMHLGLLITELQHGASSSIATDVWYIQHCSWNAAQHSSRSILASQAAVA